MTENQINHAEPRTLAEAHESLMHWWPGSSAQSSALAEYYRRAAGVYAEVAKVDTGRLNETNWWVRESARLAEEYAAKAAAVSSEGST